MAKAHNIAGIQYQNSALAKEGLGTGELPTITAGLDVEGVIKISNRSLSLNCSNRIGWQSRYCRCLFQPVIWCLTGDDYVVNMTLAQARATNTDESGFLLQFGNGLAADVAHARAQTSH